jgi:Ca-activated chloride channel family protein
MFGLGFQHPILLLVLLALLPAAAAWVMLERRRRVRAASWSSPALIPNMVPRDPGRRRFVPLALFGIGLVVLLTGFARPEATLTEPREGATVVLALDDSGSMAATDIKPTRLRAADAAITQFLKDLPAKYRVSLVTFSNRPSVRVPPTYDHQLILQQLPRTAEVEGSAIGDGIKQAVAVATTAVGKSRPGAPHPPAAVLLLSDGNQNEGNTSPQTSAAQARKLDVPVSTVSLGTTDGVVFQKVAGGFTEQHAVPVASQDLRAVARTSGGRFFAAKSAQQLQQVYKDLGSRLAKQKKKREITQWWTMSALAIIAVGAGFSGVWFRRLV